MNSMKLIIACILIISCPLVHAMQNERDAAKDQFQQSSLILHRQYATQTPAQMVIGTPAYEELRVNTEKLMDSHKLLTDMGQDTAAARVTLRQHIQQLLAILHANLPPEARANGL